MGSSKVGNATLSNQAFSLAMRFATCAINPAMRDPQWLRGALFVRAIQLYTPDLKLTKKQTADPVIQARFNARETPLAKFRLPVDRRYFETALCLVRLQPELSVRLVKTDNARQMPRWRQ